MSRERRFPPVLTDASGDQPKSLVMHILKNIRIGSDLSTFSMPLFVFEPRSFLESLTDFLSHPSYLLGFQRLPDPMERIVAIARWYLSGFHTKPKGPKKPYNPLLGEIFRCVYVHDDPADGVTGFVAEQVSHHPPVSAFHAENEAHQIYINGWLRSKPRFQGNSVCGELEGDVVVRCLSLPGEEYRITFPTIYVRGVLIGSVVMELGGKVRVVCERTGLQANLEFKTKPMFGGDYNGIRGYVKKIGDNDKNSRYHIRGWWDDYLDIEDAVTRRVEMFFDTRAVVIHPKVVPPLSEQLPYESRRVWQHVSEALGRRHLDDATRAKQLLENIQREETKARKDAKIEWTYRLFRKLGDRYQVTPEAQAALLRECAQARAAATAAAHGDTTTTTTTSTSSTTIPSTVPEPLSPPSSSFETLSLTDPPPPPSPCTLR
eukprot:gnl/Spiro4/1349_TR720_c0_g1_i1.p1 gnl/Spiro4/1349_TR720_c0_g1~~gnl/Spiro4/1349_TR720_c0_g1_i1.p1  ORF type:complete len:442 (+),score=79.35 gnl/Spiro4/1349_TR720_c0_g1_i1:33-1328(+)